MAKQQPSNPDPTERKRGFKPLGVGLIVVFLLAAGSTAFLAFAATRDFVTSWNLTNLPGISINRDPTGTPGAEAVGTPSLPRPSGGPTPQPWDGASRVSVLVMGLDYRDWESNQGAPRTDTMMLLTIDPLSRTGGMLSIPRDMWVNIPGFEPNKINTAYRFGEVYKLPDGGPGLAMRTVEQLLGVPVDYYALIDFYAFERFIDELGGIDVSVSEEIKVDPLGPGNTVVLKPGDNHLDGPVALAYARARYTEGGDFDRSARQQQVILAIRDRVLSLNMVPTLIGKAPTLYNELASGIQTTLSLDDAIKLGLLALQIQEGDIQKGVIGKEQVAFGKSPDGLDVLKPIPEKIRLLRDEIFTTDLSSSPAAQANDPLELVRAENARLKVLNGASVFPQNDGLAARTQAYLQSQGFNVAEIGNAQETVYTTIVDYTGNPYTIKVLVEMMGISPNRIYSRFDPASLVDIELDLGNDWAVNHKMP